MSSMWWAVLAAALCVGARAQRPRPVCPRDHASRCVAEAHDDSTYHFNVNGMKVTYEFNDGNYFALVCPPSLAIDERALPQFEPELRVNEVRLDECWPRASSYADALNALNITGLEAPSPGDTPTLPPYRIQLNLKPVDNYDPKVLAAMTTLYNLTINSKTFTGADFALLPISLETVKLLNARITHVPATAFARLSHLAELWVDNNEPIELELAGNLKSLAVYSTATTLVTPSLPDTLEGLILKGWTVRHPLPWRSCASLYTLDILEAATETLPDDWLAHCTHLRKLCLNHVTNLKTLAAGALRGAIALERVEFTNCALEALPAGLLDDARALRVLHLHGNLLHALPGELFRWSVALSELDLSVNRLTVAVLSVLKGATSLNKLRLDNNPALDACPLARDSDHNSLQGSSRWLYMKNLKLLLLQRTATRRVCAEWRQLPRLKWLDLSDTAVTQLDFSDLQFNITVNITIVLPSVDLSLSRHDYTSVATAVVSGPTVTLRLTEPLRCDCELYWAAAALRLPFGRLRENSARCKGNNALRDVPLDELMCTPPGPCPRGCSCGAREDVARPGRVLQLDCSRAKLNQVPRVDARATLRDAGAELVELILNLKDNHIERLTPEHFPPELAVLDLRNNWLNEIDVPAARALISRPDRRVMINGNPIECECHIFATLLAAREARPDVFIDWNDATCYNGMPLHKVYVPYCIFLITHLLANITRSLLDNTTEIQYTTRATVPDSVEVTSEGILQYTTHALVPGNAPDNTSEGVLYYTTPQAPRSPPEDESGGMSRGLVMALALGAAALGAVVAAALGRAALRWRARAALRALPPPPLQLQRRQPAADEWHYDAFVSFAHADEAVALELVERLEGGPAPLRLCVHYRDWAPGGWIPAQIALSVRVSRRTVAVVSEAFLRSKWARAEFREAYAAAQEDSEPRLVLVLLEDPARLPLDAELRAFVNDNTYVRWDDPWFWRKLYGALPTPSLRPAVESASATSSPAPTEPMMTLHV